MIIITDIKFSFDDSIVKLTLGTTYRKGCRFIIPVVMPSCQEKIVRGCPCAIRVYKPRRRLTLAARAAQAHDAYARAYVRATLQYSNMLHCSIKYDSVDHTLSKLHIWFLSYLGWIYSETLWWIGFANFHIFGWTPYHTL